MSKTLYLKNAEAENDEWWKKVLIDCSKWEQLIKSKDIIKSGCYYPRLKDSNKRGIHAFKEVANKHFQETDKEFLLGLCRMKVCPQVNIDTLIINVDDITKYGLYDFFNKYYLLKSDTPFNAVVNDLNVMPSHEKLNQVEDMIENLEFTPYELSKLIKICSNLLIEFHQ